MLQLSNKPSVKQQALNLSSEDISVTLSLQALALEPIIAQFFQRSVGHWHSDRRYYTLPHGDTKEMVSFITIRFLSQGCDSLRHLAQLHELPDATLITCGTEVTWDSKDSVSGQKQSQGSTLFGVSGDLLYRDRGFATPKPITAKYTMANPETLTLRTEYKGSVFEEEVKLVGQNYRTRQTIISRAGEQQMIGQYLEKRING
ncbi:MAG: phycobiliprotein lyase [Leptolyngbyaceae cyanobacterium CSU_1_4]|nr:phycobiliprotein lyase [Leptolyngbyaceae cyanobacterium CSU_1_4]